MTSKPSTTVRAGQASAPKVKTIAYDVAVTRGRKAIAAQDKTNFTLGDIAAAVETVTYGEGTIQRLADDLGVEYRTLMDFRKVSRQYAPAERSALNTWTVHQIFGRQPKRAELVAARKWTTPEARAEVKRLNGSDETDPAITDPENTDAPAAPVDERAKLVARIDSLKGQLATAEAALAAYDAEHNESASDSTPATDTHFKTAGIPSHAATEPRTDCDECKANGIVPMPAPRRSRSRKPAAAAAA
jgi:hypothetical protein